MLKLVDFEKQERMKFFYGGNAGAKEPICYDNAAWMVKYPKPTKGFSNPQVSYTTSPISEYLGSKIYETFNVPVHKTLLGVRRNKVVVACKDFTKKLKVPVWEYRKTLIPFHDLKNSFMSSDIDAYSGTGSETLLSEVLATIEGQEDLQQLNGVTERFWDMFVIDAFIGNNDRNNGNWGILIDQKNNDIALAPVFDNGSAFFNKRSLSQMQKRLTDETAMKEDAYRTATCAYKYAGLDNEGHRINPFRFMREGGNLDCETAVARFIERVDLPRINKIITEIPEDMGTLAVMPQIQKEFYMKLLDIRLRHIKGEVTWK